MAQDLAKEGLKGRCVTVKFKQANYQVLTRSKTLLVDIKSAEALFEHGRKVDPHLSYRSKLTHEQILEHELKTRNGYFPLRLMGIRLGTLSSVDSYSEEETGLTKVFFLLFLLQTDLLIANRSVPEKEKTRTQTTRMPHLWQVIRLLPY